MLRPVLSALLTVVLACQGVAAGLADDGKKPELLHFAKASKVNKDEIFAQAKCVCVVEEGKGAVQIGTPDCPDVRLVWMIVDAVLADDLYVVHDDFDRSRTPFALHVPGNAQIHDGARIAYFIRPVGLHEYQSVRGLRRLQKYMPAGKRLTKKDWVKALRKGKAFRFRMRLAETCPKCRGLSNRRNCKRCKGTGKVHDIRKLKIVW